MPQLEHVRRGLVVLCVLAAGAASGDRLFFKTGGKVEGGVVDKSDCYEVTHRFGKVTVPKDTMVNGRRTTVRTQLPQRRGMSVGTPK